MPHTLWHASTLRELRNGNASALLPPRASIAHTRHKMVLQGLRQAQQTAAHLQGL